MKSKIYFIDPQSYHNLEEYDSFFIEEANKFFDVKYFCNYRYGGDFIGAKPIFVYSEKSNKLMSFLSYLCSFLKIASSSIKERPKIIHYQWTKVLLLDILFVWFFRITGSNVVLTAHNYIEHQGNSWWSRFFQELRYFVFGNVIVHDSDFKIKLQKQHENLNVRKINHPYIFSLRKHPSCYYGTQKPNEIKIGMLGRSLKYKNYEGFLDQLSKSPMSNVCCVVLTDPKLIVPKNIRVETHFSYMNNEKFLNLVDSVDIVAVPHLEISASGLMMTGLARCKPIVFNEECPALKYYASDHPAAVISETKFFSSDFHEIIEWIESRDSSFFYNNEYDGSNVGRDLVSFYFEILK